MILSVVRLRPNTNTCNFLLPLCTLVEIYTLVESVVAGATSMQHVVRRPPAAFACAPATTLPRRADSWWSSGDDTVRHCTAARICVQFKFGLDLTCKLSSQHHAELWHRTQHAARVSRPRPRLIPSTANTHCTKLSASSAAFDSGEGAPAGATPNDDDRWLRCLCNTATLPPDLRPLPIPEPPPRTGGDRRWQLVDSTGVSGPPVLTSDPKKLSTMDETSGEHKPEVPKNENDSVISIKVKDQQGQEVRAVCWVAVSGGGADRGKAQKQKQRSLTGRLAVVALQIVFRVKSSTRFEKVGGVAAARHSVPHSRTP